MDSYSDLANRREVYIQRFASHLRNEYTDKGIYKAYRAVRLALLDAENIDSIAKRNLVNQAVKDAVAPITKEMWQGVTGELNDYSAQEATYYASMFGEVNAVALSVPASDKILSYINKSVMKLVDDKKTQEGVWSKFVTANRSSIVDAYQSQIKKGYRSNETVSQMVKRVKRVSDNLLKRQAEALVRTGTAHYSQQARSAMMQDNLDIVDREIPLITFDNRVTDTCISIGARYPNGWEAGKSPIGYNPYHWGCRTTIQWLVKGQKSIDGDRAAVKGLKSKDAEDSFNARQARLNAKRNDPDNTKPVASKVIRKGNKDPSLRGEYIKADTPFAEFLKTQPEWYVKSTLGAKRAAMFMNGELDLSKLTDKNLKPLTLEQLSTL